MAGTKPINPDAFLVCEDIRLEANGQATLVGVFGDTLTIPWLPLVFPRLSVFARISGLPPGEYTYSLTVTDAVQNRAITSTGEQSCRIAKSGSYLATILARFGSVEVRSWDFILFELIFEGFAPFVRRMLLQPPSWSMLFTRCQQCKHLVPTGIDAKGNSAPKITDSSVRCPKCKTETRFDTESTVRPRPPSFSLDSLADRER